MFRIKKVYQVVKTGNGKKNELQKKFIIEEQKSFLNFTFWRRLKRDTGAGGCTWKETFSFNTKKEAEKYIFQIG